MNAIIVEDNKMIQKGQKMLLEDFGYEVHVASNGESACRLVQDFVYDVALIDIGLPDMSGIEVIKLLRKNSASTQVIVGTTYIDDNIRKNCMDAGSNLVLSKPLTAEVLQPYL